MNGVVFVTESMPLLEALRRIDRGNLQLAVVERDGWIVGTVTDGDVRRGLLNGVSLDAPVEQVMNRTPITAPAGISDTAALTLMRRKSIHQLPIVDAEGKVIEVKLIDDLVTASQSDHWVVLMAGGLGSRLKPLTDDLPKPLIKVGDKPILETVLGGFIKSNKSTSRSGVPLAACSPVSISPGATAFTRMPSVATSRASPIVKLSIAPLDAA